MIEHNSHSESETEAIGREFARQLGAGDVLLISGPLGAGKTAFVRGLAQGLGCEADDVSSPTFTLIQTYPGRIALEHVDLYRLAPHEVDDLGLDEPRDGAVLAIEWAEHWASAPPGSIHIRIDVTNPTERRISIDDTRASS
jgi:tRNA threonylcarbamoyladenosine biosynthesis protein TsaE